jgi:hypothetical protein
MKQKNKRIIFFSLLLNINPHSIPQPYTIKKVQAQIHDNAGGILKIDLP